MQLYSIEPNQAFLVSVKALIIKDSRLLLIKNPGKEDLVNGKWALPGGIIDFSEDIKEGLLREINEETGLDVEVGELFDVGLSIERDFVVQDGRKLKIRLLEVVYWCEYKDGDVVLSDEHVEFKWANKEEMKDLEYSKLVDFAIQKYINTG